MFFRRRNFTVLKIIKDISTSTLVSGLIILTTQSCTTSRYKEVHELSAKGECENASTTFVKSQHGANFGETVQTTTGKVSSYGLGTIGYTADTVIVASLGIVMIAVVCSPGLLISAASGSVSHLGCLNLVGNKPKKTTPKSENLSDKKFGLGIGDGVLDTTSTWRENPAVEQFSQTIRNIATCYKKRGDVDSLIKAQNQLDQLKISSTEGNQSDQDQNTIYALTSKEERKKIDLLGDEIKSDLLRADPEYQQKLAAEQAKQMEILMQEHSPEIWRDTATGKFWRFQAATVSSAKQAESLCENARYDNHNRWTIASEGDIETAIENGLVDPKVNTNFVKAHKMKFFAFISNKDEENKLINLSNGQLTTPSKESITPIGLICTY